MDWYKISQCISAFASTSLAKSHIEQLSLSSTIELAKYYQKESMVVNILENELNLNFNLNDISSEVILETISLLSKRGLLLSKHLVAVAKIMTLAQVFLLLSMKNLFY